MSATPKHLGELPMGASATVRKVGGDPLTRRRLLELGLLPGTAVEVVRRAPLGDPIELNLRGYRLSIRGTDARAIAVEPVTAFRAYPPLDAPLESDREREPSNAPLESNRESGPDAARLAERA